MEFVRAFVISAVQYFNIIENIRYEKHQISYLNLVINLIHIAKTQYHKTFVNIDKLNIIYEANVQFCVALDQFTPKFTK